MRLRLKDGRRYCDSPRLIIRIDGLEVMNTSIWMLMAMETCSLQTPRRVATRLASATKFDCELQIPGQEPVRFQDEMPEWSDDE